MTIPSPKLPPSGAEWAAFHRLPPAERRVALVLERADDAGLAAAADLLDHLARAGYAVEQAAGAASLRKRVADAELEPFSRADYAGFFAALPREEQNAINRRWGAPEADPGFRPGRLDCGALLLPVLRLGRVALAIRRDAATAPPSHGDVALDAWVEDGFRAHAMARIAADGTLAWRLAEIMRRVP